MASAVLPTFFRLEPDGTTTPVDVTAGGTLEAGRAYWAFASQEARLTWGSAPRVTSLTPLSGPSAGGTAVTLTGTGFTGTTAVSFGSQPANSFTVSSDTQIVATAPANVAGLAVPK